MRAWKNEAVVLIDQWNKGFNPKIWDDALQFLIDYDQEYGELEISPSEDIDEIVQQEAKEWGWQRVACFLYGVQNAMNEDFYRLDGYGNVQLITSNNIYDWLCDIANN